MTNTTKYFLYARKSTDDKDCQVRSIDDQLAEVRDLAARRGFEIADLLVEKQSAKKPGRPVFNEMLERIEKSEAQATRLVEADPGLAYPRTLPRQCVGPCARSSSRAALTSCKHTI
jgi:hypothetical protein